MPEKEQSKFDKVFDQSVYDAIDAFLFEKRPNVRNAKLGEIYYGTEGMILSATALGSCVAVILYDDTKKMAGIAHVALPASKEITRNRPLTQLGKFADTAIPELVNQLKKKGAIKLKAKIAGGSKLIRSNKSNEPHLGLRNAVAVKEELKKFNIPIMADDTDGTFSRSVSFNIDDNRMEIRKTVTAEKVEDYRFENYVL